jgi:hypothetical protein
MKAENRRSRIDANERRGVNPTQDTYPKETERPL